MNRLSSLCLNCADWRKLDFGDYLESAIRDQFVCGLRDSTTQWELLCVPDLTALVALHKARAAEAVYKETQGMKDTTGRVAALRVSSSKACFRCGKSDHVATNCKFKTAKCHECQKVGHLPRVCMAKNRFLALTKSVSKQSKSNAQKPTDLHQLEATETDLSQQ